MKSLKYFFGMLLVASVVSLVSCKDDDEKKKPDFTADYPEADAVAGQITIFAKFESNGQSILCPNGVVVLNGSFNLTEPDEDGNTDWRTDNPDQMPKFASAGTIDGKDWGAEGWYKVTVSIPASAAIEEHNAVLGAKPIHLNDGKFYWDFQIGNENSVEVKSGDVDVQAGYANECNIYFSSNATAAIIFKAWKNDPCVDLNDLTKHEIKFNATVPEGTPEDAVVRIVGAFEFSGYPNWAADGEGMEMTKGADGKYSITLSLAEGKIEYKYVINGSWAGEEYDENCESIDNREITVSGAATKDDVVINWKGFGDCALGEEVDVTFVVTVPESTPEDAVIYIAGDFGNAGYPAWGDAFDSEDMKLTKNADGTYSITLEGIAEGTEYKYVLNGSWDTAERTEVCGEVPNRKTGSSPTIEDVVANWDGYGDCAVEDVPGGEGTFIVTITSTVEEGAEIIFTGNFDDKGWGESDRVMTFDEDTETYFWTGEYPENFKCKVIKRISGEEDAWSSGPDQVFDGENFEFEFSFE